MGDTMAQKFLASHADVEHVQPGEYIWANIDGTALVGFSGVRMGKRLADLGVEQLFDPDRIYAVEDHLAPAPSVEAANATVALRKMVEKYGIKNYFEWGRHGILHELFPQHGYCSPGDLIASVDSHSTS